MARTYQSGTKTVFYKEKRVINWKWHYNVGIASSHYVLLPPQDSIWTSEESPRYVKYVLSGMYWADYIFGFRTLIKKSKSLLKLVKPVKNYQTTKQKPATPLGLADWAYGSCSYWFLWIQKFKEFSNGG